MMISEMNIVGEWMGRKTREGTSKLAMQRMRRALIMN